MATLHSKLEPVALTKALRTAVCSDSALARTITKAIGWLGGTPHLKSFDFGQRAAALDFLRVPEPDRTEILRTARNLEGELPRRRANGR